MGGRPLQRKLQSPTVLFLLLSIIVGSSSLNVGLPPPAMVMPLERAFPIGGDIQALRARDGARHARLLQQRSSPSIVNFPVDGSSDPYAVGLYYTRVKLGNPPREFHVQIDTGSDVLWITCNPCNGCPSSSGLPISLRLFDPLASSTASFISCSDQRCNFGLKTAEASCTLTNSGASACGYNFQYGDGSGTSGYYVQDTMYFETVVADQLVANASANVIFGCSNLQTGDLTKPDRAIDGIFGFGQNEFSVVSQLSSLGVAPKVFSHCLKGSDSGGGILVLGEIVEPGIVYTPLVPFQTHYNINLRSISINRQILPIDPKVFSTSNFQGTIIDSGTTLAYLADEAYDPFINGIMSAVSPSVRSLVLKGTQCFITTDGIENIFPSVSLNFEGGASMILKPEDYLLKRAVENNALMWCIGWQKNQGQGITILGDLVLKDKIFVYDLGAQRIGWVNYDCSQSVNVSGSSGRSDFLNSGQFQVTGPSSKKYYHSLLVTLGAMYVVHILILLHM